MVSKPQIHRHLLECRIHTGLDEARETVEGVEEGMTVDGDGAELLIAERDRAERDGRGRRLAPPPPVSRPRLSLLSVSRLALRAVE